MKFKFFSMQVIVLLLCCGETSFLTSGEGKGHGEEEVRRKEEAKKELDKREKTIKDKEKVLKELESKKEKATEDLEEEYRERDELEGLMREQVKAYTDFGDEFGKDFKDDVSKTDERKKQLIDEEAAQEKKNNALERKLAAAGVDVNKKYVITSPDIIIGLKNSSFGEKFKTRLLTYLQEAKARIAETMLGNKDMAIKARANLDSLYQTLNDPFNRASNARSWGKLMPKARDEILRDITEFKVYTKQLDDIVNQIKLAKTDFKRRELLTERDKLQEKAIESVLGKIALDLELIQEQLIGDVTQAQDPKNKELENAVEEILKNIHLVEVGADAPYRSVRTAKEKAAALAKDTRELNASKKDTSVSSFVNARKELVGNLATKDLKTVIGSKEYKIVMDNLAFLSGIDVSQRSLDDLLFISDTLRETYEQLSNAILARLPKLYEEYAKDPSKGKEFDAISVLMSDFFDNSRAWSETYQAALTSKSAGSEKLLSKDGIKQYNKIKEDNKNVKTNIDSGEPMERLPGLADPVLTQIQKAVKNVDNIDDFTAAMSQIRIQEFVSALDNAAPSKAAIEIIAALRDSYAELNRNLLAQAKIIDETLKDENKRNLLVDWYIKNGNEAFRLKKYQASYQNILTVVIDGHVIMMDQMDRAYARELQKTEKTPLDKYEAQQLAEIRSKAKLPLERIDFTSKNKKLWREFLFPSEKAKANNSGDESGDEGSGTPD